MKEGKGSSKTGSLFIPGLEEYINQNLVPRPDPIFWELEEYAKKFHIPILNPMAGAALASWVRFHKPKRILELGTGAGYSLHWLLAYADFGVELKTYERRESLVSDVRKFWDRSPYRSKANVEFVNGEILAELRKEFKNLSTHELVFVDSDKVTYPEIFALWLESLRNSDPSKKIQSTILFDNALWHGRIMNPDPQKKSDQAITLLWERVRSSGLYYDLNPSGDGLLAVYSWLNF